MIKIFHRRGEFLGFEKVAQLGTLDELTLTQNLERAFELTNHITEKGWTHNEEVTQHNLGHHPRSTSVGDILVLDKEVYVVDGCGYTHLNGAGDEPNGIAGTAD